MTTCIIHSFSQGRFTTLGPAIQTRFRGDMCTNMIKIGRNCSTEGTRSSNSLLIYPDHRRMLPEKTSLLSSFPPFLPPFLPPSFSLSSSLLPFLSRSLSLFPLLPFVSFFYLLIKKKSKKQTSKDQFICGFLITTRTRKDA